jgi:rubrerythrin
MTADLTRGSEPAADHWTLDDLQLERIERDKVRGDELIYALVTAASFVETAAELYTSNLVLHFPDARARAWLANRWRPEELQHGRALRAYVEAAWPELDWDQGYRGFFDDYSRLCTMDELEASRALEMAARCVVETGTATFYTSLHALAHEPVLRRLAGFIRRDEVRHYNYFRSFYQDYQAEERVGRLGVLRALHKRFTEAEQEDAYIGFRHAWLMRHPGETFQDEYFTAFMRQVRMGFAPHYPYRMMIRMLLQPLDLNRTVQKLAIPLLARGARRLMFH